MSENPSPVVALTGGSRGIGLATLRSLLDKYHARVGVISRTKTQDLVELERQYGPERLIVIVGDISREEDCAGLVSTVIAKWEVLDAVVLNAGIVDPICMSKAEPFEEC
jgi:NAD(P)-dependent dehydrogenase (short-subunit alcohol dehydrogenase family)